MNGKKEIKWFSDQPLSQIYSSGLEYAFFSEKYEQCHPFAYCKDFLQDAVWAQLNNRTVEIYRFSYVPGINPPLDLATARIALRNKSDERFEKHCANSLTYVNDINKIMGFSPTLMEPLGNFLGHEEEKPVFLSIGDKQWLHSPVMLSAYTLLLRIGMSFEGGNWEEHFIQAKRYLGSRDSSYSQRALSGLKKIIGKKPGEVFAAKMEKNYPKKCAALYMHNNSGIISFSEGTISVDVKEFWGK